MDDLYNGNTLYPYIFIQYSHEDAERVIPIIKALRTKNYNIVFDKNFGEEDRYRYLNVPQITQAAAILIFYSKAAAKSRLIKETVRFAVPMYDLKKFCVCLDNAKFGLSFSDLKKNYTLIKEDNIEKLIYVLKDYLNSFILSKDMVSYAWSDSQGEEIKTNKLEEIEDYDETNGLIEAREIDPKEDGTITTHSPTNPKEKLPMTTTEYDIFISFKDRNDDAIRTWASKKGEHIYHTLISKGYHPFYSRESMESMAGEQVSPLIDYALSTAKVMILVFSSPWEVNSEWVRYEWGEFMRMKKPILTVFKGMKSEDRGQLQPELADTQGFDLTDEVGNHTYNRIFDAVERLYSRSDQSAVFRTSQSWNPEQTDSATDVESEYELGEMYADFDGEEHDYKRAFESYIKAANAGHAEANYRIGYMYANGLGVKKDLSRAVSWYEKAAGYGNSDIMFRVGEFTYKNNYHKKAFIWFEKAAKAGHVEAMVSFGKMLQADMGIRSDKDNKVKAFGWFSKAAELGNDEAMRMLGYMYENGFGVDSDIEKAIECYTKAAEAGNTEAMCDIAKMYNWGWGVNKDGQKAIEWYTKALNAGEYYALIYLARLYESGIIVEKDNAKAYELYAKAAEWYTKEAEAGDTHAMRIIANMYENGDGVEQNYEKSIEWYTKAAEAGDTDAMIDIGMIHDYAMDDYNKAVEWYSKAGKYGDPDYIFCRIGWRYDIGFRSLRANWRKAVEWYTKAANVGSIEAMKSLGRIYCKKEDYDKAIEWYTKAADVDDSEAMREIGAIYEQKLEDFYDNFFGYGMDENIHDSVKLREQIREQIIEWYTKAVKAGDDRSKRKLEYYQGKKDFDYRAIIRYIKHANERRNSKK